MVDDGGPDFSFISNPEQLIRSELGAVAGFGQSGFGEQILLPMVTISEVGATETGWSLIFSKRAQASSKASWNRCPWGRSSGNGGGGGAVLVFQGGGAGLGEWVQMAFSWAPTVVVSLPARCHMPSRRCFNSRYRRSCCS